MNDQTLVRMLNQIGYFFEPMPDRGQALQDIAQHVAKFWEPRMRQQLLEYVDQHGGEGLTEIASLALARHRDLIA